MLKEEVVVLSLEDKLDGEKLKSHVYGSDLKANTIWVWLILFIFIFVTVMLLKNDIAIWLCALCGAIIGGFTGYNQPTYLGITNKGNLIVSKFKLDNKTPRFVTLIKLSDLEDVKLISNSKSGKNILRFKYNGKKHEYLYLRNVKSKYLKNQAKNVDIFNNSIKR